MIKKVFCMLFGLLQLCLPTMAEVVMPKIWGSNMVLQRNKPVPVWGIAAAGEKVTVKFGKQIKATFADASGKWGVTLNPLMASSKPADMVISGTNTITYKNVLVGEVWLCSGQSNMEYEMRKNSKVAKPDSTDKNSPVDELERAHNSQIRIFVVTQKNLWRSDPTRQGWSIAQDSALRVFSAAGYFFAKKINAELQVPVGMICSAVSGSRIEPWLPLSAFEALPYFKDKKVDGDPGKFYTKMIAPLAPFALKGFLWYQGETNCFLGDSVNYTYKMLALIKNWRATWNDDQLPFYYVQIAPFNYSKQKGQGPGTVESLPKLREAQAMALTIPNTGMIVTTDLNDNLENIHPSFKWEIGRRLALVALAKTYNKPKVVFSGPMYKAMQINKNTVELTFNYTGSGMQSKDGKPLNYFTIAGADRKFVPAQAVIKGNKLIVSAALVQNPVAVRFAWQEDAQPNFYNKEGLPAMPFRTDNPFQFSAN
jgi:sialate O-acetylesterase